MEHPGKISMGKQPVLTPAEFSCATAERPGYKRPWVHVSCRQENRAGLFCFWKFSFLPIPSSLPASTNRCFQGMPEPSLVQSADPCKHRRLGHTMASFFGSGLWHASFTQKPPNLLPYHSWSAGFSIISKCPQHLEGV